jgi:C-terminal processing protease CtpA/Prc
MLTQSIGYIRIKTLALEHVGPDRERIHLFLARAADSFSKLIIDLRDNGGGCTEYVYENLMKRFLKQRVSYEQITGVRRKFIDDHSRAYIDSKLALDSIHGGETSVVEVEPPQGFDSSKWVFYEISRELEPQNRYPFEGDIFVLINERTGSAADDFANAVKRIGMATLVGQNTHGSCAAYLGPIAVRLPESGMEFMLEVDLLINPDGTYNEITGTPPDIRLPPVDTPESVTREAMLGDDWIRKIISDL